MSDNTENKREYNRYPLEFEADISTFSGTEKQRIERVTLKDISGGGACFISSHPGLYSMGQKIFLNICLPETGNADVRMEGEATLVWIGEPGTAKAGEPSRMEIGISMDNLLSFQLNPRGTDSGGENPG